MDNDRSRNQDIELKVKSRYPRRHTICLGSLKREASASQSIRDVYVPPYYSSKTRCRKNSIDLSKPPELLVTTTNEYRSYSIGLINLQQQEDKLAAELKEMCYANGREKQPVKSAQILHKLGRIYWKRSPDKICLIQSAALFNSAIIRKPDNVSEIESDLDQLCAHILQISNAQNLNYDLIEAAKHIKHDIVNMREKVDERLKKLKLIPEDTKDEQIIQLEKNKIVDVMELQGVITEQYKDIMKEITKSCIQAMGEPPCKFALIGMGSLVRKEITPYSDFESAIVLDEVQYKYKYDHYQSTLAFFRGFALIFQIILVNLQETLLRFVNIPCLNDASKPGGDWFYDAFTPCGISPDGFAPKACKNPLGRQRPTSFKSWTTELIKPVSEMIKYLDSKEALKNGYYLADILSRACLVSGNEEIYNLFCEKVIPQMFGLQKEIQKEFATMHNRLEVIKLLGELYDIRGGNVKAIIYRLISFYIASLGKLSEIPEASCFKIIQKLEKKQLFSHNDAHKISYAVAIACEIRLKIYNRHKSQSDWIEHRPHTVSEFSKTVGRKSLIDCFKILLQFQFAIKKFALKYSNWNKMTYLELDNKSSFLSEITACYYLHFYEKCINLCKAKLQDKDNCSTDTIKHCHHYIGMCLRAMGQNEASNGHFELAMEDEKVLSDNAFHESTFHRACCMLSINGKNHTALERFGKHLRYLQKNPNEGVNSAMKFKFKPSWNKYIEYLSDTVQCMGKAYYNLDEHDTALKFFEKAETYTMILHASDPDDKHLIRILAFNYSASGSYLIKMERYEEAKNKLKKALKLYKQIVLDETTDYDIQMVAQQISICP